MTQDRSICPGIWYNFNREHTVHVACSSPTQETQVTATYSRPQSTVTTLSLSRTHTATHATAHVDSTRPSAFNPYRKTFPTKRAHPRRGSIQGSHFRATPLRYVHLSTLPLRHDHCVAPAPPEPHLLPPQFQPDRQGGRLCSNPSCRRQRAAISSSAHMTSGNMPDALNFSPARESRGPTHHCSIRQPPSDSTQQGQHTQQ